MTSPKTLLTAWNLRAKKALGQNFLSNPQTAEAIVARADLKPGDVVLEIGPGLGALTIPIARRVRRVIAVETDPEMMEYMMFMKHGEFIKADFPICSTEPFQKMQQIVAQGIEVGELRQGNYLYSAISYSGVILRAAELSIQGVLQTSLFDCQEELIANAWAAIKA